MKATAWEAALAEYNRTARGVMRSWALLWRAEVAAFGRTDLAAMCLRNARRWRAPGSPTPPAAGHALSLAAGAVQAVPKGRWS